MGRSWRREVLALVAAAGLLTAPGAYAVPSTVTSTVPSTEPAGTPLAHLALPAHSALVSIVPADGAVLDSGPTELVLTFNEKINPQFTQLVLSRSGAPVSLGVPTVSGSVLRAPLAAPGPGSYQVAYRVVSADGHPISGESGFTVKGAVTTAAPTPTPTTAAAAGTPSARPAAAPVASVAPVASAAPAGSSATPWLAAGGGLLLLAAAAGIWGRARARDTDTPDGPGHSAA